MARKINKRKKIQAAKRKAELAAKPKPRRIGMIAARPTTGLGMTLLAMLALKGRNYD